MELIFFVVLEIFGYVLVDLLGQLLFWPVIEVLGRISRWDSRTEEEAPALLTIFAFFGVLGGILSCAIYRPAWRGGWPGEIAVLLFVPPIAALLMNLAGRVFLKGKQERREMKFIPFIYAFMVAVALVRFTYSLTLRP